MTSQHVKSQSLDEIMNEHNPATRSQLLLFRYGFWDYYASPEKIDPDTSDRGGLYVNTRF